MTLEFMNTCAKCGNQFAADEDWKSICLPCYKQGWRQRKDGGLYQKADSTPKKNNTPVPSTGGNDAGVLNEILETLRDIAKALWSINEGMPG